MLTNKNITVCVCGGIAVYKVVDVVSRLKKQNANISVAMTESASKMVAPLTFQSISHNFVITSLFEEKYDSDIKHISLAQKADLIVVAPATANIIGKVANGIADDIVSTTIIAATAPVLFVPAMNTAMYENPIVQDNIKKLKKFGYHFMEPEVGTMAMKSEKAGTGRLPQPVKIVEHILDMKF